MKRISIKSRSQKDYYNIERPIMNSSTINKATHTPTLNGDWNQSCWSNAETLSINNFRPEGSDHKPITKARIIYNSDGLHIIFRVQDQYVRSMHTELNSSVCKDSCVEFFVMPKPGKGYLNFETNCGGTILAYHIEDCTKTETGFAKSNPLSEADASLVGIYHSMPTVVNPEITEPTEWINQLFIPFSLLEKYVGELGDIPGQSWRANFYKCGDKTSHPHWASWNQVTELNFHMPDCFGEIRFA